MNAAHDAGEGLLNPDLLIPIVAPAVTFGAIIVIVGFVLYFRYRTQALRQDLFTTYLDKGLPIPKALLAQKPQARNVDLRRGLVLLLGGIGLSGALLLCQQWQAAGFGLVPTFIGVAFLLVWKLESRPGGAAEGLEAIDGDAQ